VQRRNYGNAAALDVVKRSVPRARVLHRLKHGPVAILRQVEAGAVLEGRVRITVGDGASREFAPGDLLLLEDTWGEGHVTRFLTDRVVVCASALTS
jgi:hypothetical protein